MAKIVHSAFLNAKICSQSHEGREGEREEGRKKRREGGRGRDREARKQKNHNITESSLS